jgi:hypothetical protein
MARVDRVRSHSALGEGASRCVPTWMPSLLVLRPWSALMSRRFFVVAETTCMGQHAWRMAHEQPTAELRSSGPPNGSHPSGHAVRVTCSLRAYPPCLHRSQTPATPCPQFRSAPRRWRTAQATRPPTLRSQPRPPRWALRGRETRAPASRPPRVPSCCQACCRRSHLEKATTAPLHTSVGEPRSTQGHKARVSHTFVCVDRSTQSSDVINEGSAAATRSHQHHLYTHAAHADQGPPG